MFRQIVFAPLIACVVAAPAVAQDWARKMFPAVSHDFGTVARGAKAEFTFELTNLYKETIHISGVRASCGCAEPSVVKDTLKTWEKGGILVRFNTRSFVGQRHATITVTIDRPYYAEVQLEIRGYIRSDVVFDPGIIQFANVEQGAGAEQLLRVSYAGRNDWQIVDVLSANSNLEVSKKELRRGGGRVDYQLLVRLAPDAPTGYFTDEMILVTNDHQLRKIPIVVQGSVAPALSVSPASLYLGELRPGQTVTKQIVVRAKKPFRIVGIDGQPTPFEIERTDEAKTMHIVPITFTAPSEPGKIAETVRILTDLEPGQAAACVATGTVRTQAVTTASSEKDAQ